MKSRDANLNNLVSIYVNEIKGSESSAFLCLICRLICRGEASLVHRIGLGDWWECPVCRCSIMGWRNRVVGTMAAGWIG
jgi:hypothetical protein